MPKTKSAQKALRQNLRRRTSNVSKIKAYKKAVKDYQNSLATNNPEEIKKKLSLVYKKLDKAAKDNIIHKNKADRLKSKTASLLKKSINLTQ